MKSLALKFDEEFAFKQAPLRGFVFMQYITWYLVVVIFIALCALLMLLFGVPTVHKLEHRILYWFAVLCVVILGISASHYCIKHQYDTVIAPHNKMIHVEKTQVTKYSLTKGYGTPVAIADEGTSLIYPKLRIVSFLTPSGKTVFVYYNPIKREVIPQKH